MAEQQEGNKPKGREKFSLKTALILIAVLLLEAGAIVGVLMLFDNTQDVRADGAVTDEEASLEEPVEMEVLSERFQNTRTGRSYLYDTEIYIVTARKHESKLSERIQRREAQIRADVATVFRRAEPAHLNEFENSTLRRQIKAVLDNHLGYDEDGEPLVEEVLIPSMTRFRGDM